MNEELCALWRANPSVNPLTNRVIKIDGPVYQTLAKQCSALNASASPSIALPSISLPSISLNEKEDEFENNRIFQKGLHHLQEVLPELKKEIKNEIKNENQKDSCHVCYVIEKQVLPSAQKPLPYARTLDSLSIPNHVSYHHQNALPTLRLLSAFNCHDGQRKLTLGLLEFLAKSMDNLHCKPEDVFVVYAGGSSMAASVAISLFPELRISLYDPDDRSVFRMLPSSIKNKTMVYKQRSDLPAYQVKFAPLMIFTNNAGWFNDHTARYCRERLFPMSRRKHLLFVSDIRGDTEEYDIVTDMRSQMRWTLMLKASFYMHKFRLPYQNEENTETIKSMYDDLHHVKSFLSKITIENIEMKNNPNAILYLSGEPLLQAFGPQRTTELRLIGKAGKNNHYTFRYYDVMKTENQSALFNNVYRSYAHYAYTTMSGQKIVNSFEKVTEYYIIAQCASLLLSLLSSPESELTEDKKVKKVADLVDKVLQERISEKIGVDQCKYMSLQKYLQKNKQKYEEVVPDYFQKIFAPYRKIRSS